MNSSILDLVEFLELSLLNLNRHKVSWTQGDIKYNPKLNHKKHGFSISYDYVLKKYQNEKIRISAKFRIWFEGPWGSSFFDNI